MQCWLASCGEYRWGKPAGWPTAEPACANGRAVCCPDAPPLLGVETVATPEQKNRSESLVAFCWSQKSVLAFDLPWSFVTPVVSTIPAMDGAMKKTLEAHIIT